MIKYLQELIKSGDTVTVSVNNHYQNRGIIAIDNIGIVFENPHQPIAMPWTSVDMLKVDANG